MELLDLPTELLIRIIDLIISVPDLKTLTLVCKAIREEAVSRLYREVKVVVRDGILLPRSASFLKGRNAYHVRSLTIKDRMPLTDPISPPYNRRQLAKVHSILRTLPNGSLLQLIWLLRPSMTLTAANILFTRQKHLRAIGGNFNGSVVNEALARQPRLIPRLENLGHLDILFGDPADIGCFRAARSNESVALKNLSSLSITLHWHFSTNFSTTGWPTSGSSAVEGLVHIFIGCSTGVRPRLRRLMLRGFVRDIPPAFALKAFDLKLLQYLRLECCSSVDDFLKGLMQNNISSITDLQILTSYTSFAVLENFLLSFSGLRCLGMRFSAKSPFALNAKHAISSSAISHHGRTIRFLSIETNDGATGYHSRQNRRTVPLDLGLFLSEYELSTMIKNCPELEQVNLPITILPLPDLARLRDVLETLTTHLKQLSHLRTLGISNLAQVSVRQFAPSRGPQYADYSNTTEGRYIHQRLVCSCPMLEYVFLCLYDSADPGTEDVLQRSTLGGHNKVIGITEVRRISFRDVKNHDPDFEFFEATWGTHHY